MAILAAKQRGGIDPTGFDWDAADPDWVIIDVQVSRLRPVGDQDNGQEQAELETAQQQQVRQLIKQAIESPSADGLADFLDFTNTFRRLSIFNARLAYIQRPGARMIASEYEWKSKGRDVRADAVPIIILWPFAPTRFVYELEDTSPPIDRDSIGDPFAVKGTFQPKMLSTLASSLKKERSFRIEIEPRRQGFAYAGSAAAQGHLPLEPTPTAALSEDNIIGSFATRNTKSESKSSKSGVPSYRITVNDRLEPNERFVTIAHELGHVFCGHLGQCVSRSEADESGWRDRRHLGKPEKEVEAEATAYLVASRAGLVTGSATYLRTYARRADMTVVDIDLIVRAAARIERLAKIHYGSMLFSKPRDRLSTRR